MKTKRLLIGLFLTACAGGPYVGESRMQVVPPRPAGCDLEFVPQDMEKMKPGGEWEVIGYVTISETGVADPFAEKYKAMVRPRACAMGGEAVTMFNTAAQEGVLGQKGSGTTYGVLRRPVAAPATQKF